MDTVAFEKATAERIIRNSQYIDKRPRNKVVAPSAPVSYYGLTAMVLVGALPAGSGLNPGKGNGKIQQFNGSSFSDASTMTYTILNIHSNTIASGSLVWCGPGNGYFAFLTTSCGNVS